jgi:hypothetical protein
MRNRAGAQQQHAGEQRGKAGKMLGNIHNGSVPGDLTQFRDSLRMGVMVRIGADSIK